MISNQFIKNTIQKLLEGKDYRIEIIRLIDIEFLKYTIDFFKKIVAAKLHGQSINLNWYKEEFIKKESLKTDEIIINSGLNKKTIFNVYGTTKREMVIEASEQHYDQLYKEIDYLIQNETQLNIMLTIKFQNVSVDLNINESLIVINTLGIKRAALRGGFWSTIGKQVEKPLLQTLCKLYNIPKRNYSTVLKKNSSNMDEREIDFYLHSQGNNYKCEIKLMGKGNPEGADAALARGSKVFIADKLSNKSKKLLDDRKIEWVELKSKEGYRRFKQILEKLGIPHTKEDSFSKARLEAIWNEIFEN